MNRSRCLQLSFITGIGMLTALVTLSFNGDNSVRFVIPENFPKPVYNFAKNPVTPAGFQLGRKLFFDPVLSRDSSTSCSSCHLQFTGFTHVDHALSHGINGLKGTRNSMAIVNAAWSTSFMWDGGVNNLEVQPLNPITSPVEMDNKLANVAGKLNKLPAYKNLFYAAFGDSLVTGQRILKALAQFTVMLESYNSKYDKYMRHEPGGDLTPQEQSGLALFRQHCTACHAEPLFTDYSFQNNGLALDTALKDYGRMRITGNTKDSLKFKVPSLRNVAVSYPYMHDGRFRNLKQVLDHYTSGIVHSATLAKPLLKSMPLSDSDKADIIAFLQTLTDKDFLYDVRFRDYH
jgi:cytochrome c peroxidase